MLQQVDARLLRQIDLMAEFGRLTLSGLESVIGYQFNHAQAFIARSGDRFPDTLAASPAEWPETLQNAWREQAGATREYLRLSATIQSQMMRLIERQGCEAQDILNEVRTRVLEALTRTTANATQAGVAHAKAPTRPGRRLLSANAEEQRLAA